MIRRLPLVPTVLVGLAVALMVGLGLWQLQRAHWKNGLIARYAVAAALPPLAWPAVVAMPPDEPLFRRAGAFCLRPVAWEDKAGRNAAGAAGWVHVATCMTGGAEGPGLRVDIGWSQEPGAGRDWPGGAVEGIVTRDRHGPLLVASIAGPGLVVSAPPAMDAVPNNHFAYAIQWFLFATVAVVIYLLALRRRRA